jgi:ferritin
VLTDKLQKALNDQINAEYHSAYIYLSMAAWFESRSLEGMASWMRIQAQEELLHGMKIFDYMNERGGRIQLQPIEGPDTDWQDPLAAFQAALAHEEYMTKRVNDLAYLAQEERDNATNNLMQWFVDEQVEEEATADAIVQKLKLLGKDGAGAGHADVHPRRGDRHRRVTADGRGADPAPRFPRRGARRPRSGFRSFLILF